MYSRAASCRHVFVTCYLSTCKTTALSPYSAPPPRAHHNSSNPTCSLLASFARHCAECGNCMKLPRPSPPCHNMIILPRVQTDVSTTWFGAPRSFSHVLKEDAKQAYVSKHTRQSSFTAAKPHGTGFQNQLLCAHLHVSWHKCLVQRELLHVQSYKQ